MRLRNDTDLGARALARARGRTRRRHLADGKPEGASPADEVQALEVLGPIEPVAACASCRCRPQAHPFVVADRLDVGASVLSEPPNRDTPRAVHRPAPFRKKRLSLELLQSLSCSQTWRKGGRPVASLEIKTADELIALDVEGRGRGRGAGREARASRRLIG